MNFLKYSLITILVLVLVAGTGYLLAGTGMKSKPGYVKLVTPKTSLTSMALAIDLGPTGVKPLRWLMNHAVNSDNHGLKESEQMLFSLLQDLQGIQLRIYEVDNNRPIYEEAIDKSVSILKNRNWQTILQVRENEKRVVVMQTEDTGLIEGVSVLVTTPDNAVFMNLIGPLDPESIALVAYNMN